MALQVIDETVVTGADPASVYALLATVHLARVVTPRDVRAARARSGGTRRRGCRAALHHWPSPEPRAGGHLPTRRGLRLRARGRAAAAGLQGGVTLTPTAPGTSINWHSTFRPQVPGTGWLYRRELGRFIRRPWRGWPPQRTAPVAPSGAPGRRWRRPRRRSSRPPRGSRRPAGAGRVTRAGPARPHPDGPGARRAGRRDRRWPGGPGRAGRNLREVDGGQLEEAVAMVGHHHLGRCIGQLGPHGVDLGLCRRLLLGEGDVL